MKIGVPKEIKTTEVPGRTHSHRRRPACELRAQRYR